MFPCKPIRSIVGLPCWIVVTFRLHREQNLSIVNVKIPAKVIYRYDNAYAIEQIEKGHFSILNRAPKTHPEEPSPFTKSGKTLPRVITLGGDHTITLPLLRSINRAYGPVSVIHFDSHL
jgi:arginase family enzyme